MTVVGSGPKEFSWHDAQRLALNALLYGLSAAAVYAGPQVLGWVDQTTPAGAAGFFAVALLLDAAKKYFTSTQVILQ